MAHKFRFGAKKEGQGKVADTIIANETRVASIQKEDQAKFADAFLGYETRAPSNQNAIDLIPGWTSAFPPEFNVRAGKLEFFADQRLNWAIERFGDLKGRSVLELGPLEGAHTCTLSRAGARVDAVEGNRWAYLKCLIAKEIMGFENAKFFLGDFVLWLEENELAYDFIVACGVLYHMREPLRLLEAISKRTNSTYIWTVAVNDDRMPTERVEYLDLSVRLYEVPYGERDDKYCGGLAHSAKWMHREDILSVLDRLGFANVQTNHEEAVPEHLALSSFSIFATR